MNKNKNNGSTNVFEAEEVVVNNQAGGVAPLGMRDANLQPSEAVMKWATTAGAETPSAAEMRNVAHGGARKKTRKHKKSKKAKKGKTHTKAKGHKKSRKQKKSLKRRK